MPDWFMDKVSANDILIWNDEVKIDDGHGEWHKEKRTTCKIATLEGVMNGDHGDYIICGIKGEIYPCKPDIFEESYEEIKP